MVLEVFKPAEGMVPFVLSGGMMFTVVGVAVGSMTIVQESVALVVVFRT